MNILIAYATKTGATQKAASLLAEALAVKGVIWVPQQMRLHRGRSTRRRGVAALVEDGNIAPFIAFDFGHADVNALLRPGASPGVVSDVGGWEAQPCPKPFAMHDLSAQAKGKFTHRRRPPSALPQTRRRAPGKRRPGA